MKLMRLGFGLLIVLTASFSGGLDQHLGGVVYDQNGAVVAGANVTVNRTSPQMRFIFLGD